MPRCVALGSRLRGNERRRGQSAIVVEVVIPGRDRRSRTRNPEPHTVDFAPGFRARAFGAPRNDYFNFFTISIARRSRVIEASSVRKAACEVSVTFSIFASG